MEEKYLEFSKAFTISKVIDYLDNLFKKIIISKLIKNKEYFLIKESEIELTEQLTSILKKSEKIVTDYNATLKSIGCL